MSRDNDSQDWHCCFPVGLVFHVISRSKTQTSIFLESRLFGMCSGMLILVLLYVAISISLFDPRIHTGIIILMNNVIYYYSTTEQSINSTRRSVSRICNESSLGFDEDHVRLIPSIETTTKTKDTTETETISPWSSKHSNNTREYESFSYIPSYVLIVIVGFRALEHLYLSESFLKCCI